MQFPVVWELQRMSPAVQNSRRPLSPKPGFPAKTNSATPSHKNRAELFLSSPSSLIRTDADGGLFANGSNFAWAS